MHRALRHEMNIQFDIFHLFILSPSVEREVKDAFTRPKAMSPFLEFGRILFILRI